MRERVTIAVSGMKGITNGVWRWIGRVTINVRTGKEVSNGVLMGEKLLLIYEGSQTKYGGSERVNTDVRGEGSGH